MHSGGVEAPPTVGSSRLEAGQSDSVDEHAPLLRSRVDKQSGVALGGQLEALAAEEAVLHSAVRLAEGGPCDQHRTRHSCGGQMAITADMCMEEIKKKLACEIPAILVRARDYFNFTHT